MAFNPSFPYLQERNASDFDFQNYCKILQNAWSSTWPYKNFIFCNNIFASWGKIPFCFQGAVAVKRRLLENVCSWRSAGWGSGTNYHSPRWSSRPILHARYFEKKSPAWRKPETLGRIPGVIYIVCRIMGWRHIITFAVSFSIGHHKHQYEYLWPRA